MSLRVRFFKRDLVQEYLKLDDQNHPFVLQHGKRKKSCGIDQFKDQKEYFFDQLFLLLIKNQLATSRSQV